MLINCKNLVLLLLLSSFTLFGQNSDKISIRLDDGDDILVGVINSFSVISQADKPVVLEDIEAYLYTSHIFFTETAPIKLKIEMKYGKFQLRVDSLGWVEFRIKVNEKIEKYSLDITSLKAICYVGRRNTNADNIQAKELKLQMGMTAKLDVDDYNANCQIEKFDLIRVGYDGTVLKCQNIGARFDAQSLSIIDKASTGDLYIFRNIFYHCPNSESQRFEDIIIEIK